MPKRTDIHKIMVIGSGPIVIGQAAEFDYAGTQACLALKEEGYEIVLVNSNPATIMTDKEIADKVYIEPLDLEFVSRIIRKERPDALLASLGGQTGLNLAMELHQKGVLEECDVELLGTNYHSIKQAEDRQLFKDLCIQIHEPVLESKIAITIAEALECANAIGYPIIIRPAFTLGGTGGGFAYSDDELTVIVDNALKLSPTHQVLIERSIKGYKEIEYEVMRDKNDTAIVICNMENIDPVGVHTGDSMVVAPSQTLTNKEYQMLRNASLKIIRALGIQGGCNIQFALDPISFDYYVIEVNPRVSRSSALASKATGYPIARISAKIAVGMHLEEIQIANSSAAFEPALDYIVCKMARFPFDKFKHADRRLSTQMKATGEVMSIGRNFEEAFLKGIRSLEVKANHITRALYDTWSSPHLLTSIQTPTDERIFQIAALLRKGSSIQDIVDATAIDKFFITKFKNIIDIEVLFKEDPHAHLALAKAHGFSDAYLAPIMGMDEYALYDYRKSKNIIANYKMIDTCASEFASYVPYFYSTYGDENESLVSSKEKIILLGSGPVRIGQGIEFDYSTVHAIFAIKELGYEAIVINNNPETVSTDYLVSDKLYFEPLCIEDVLRVVDLEQPKGVIVTLGGQTAINLTEGLTKMGVPILGTDFLSISRAEDRSLFTQLTQKHNVMVPRGETAMNETEGLRIAHAIGYPLLVRPSYVLGGRAMQIVYSDEELVEYLQEAFNENTNQPVLIDEYIEGIEVEVDAICDKTDVFIPGIMEHIEKTGVHSGDSISVFPNMSLTQKTVSNIESITKTLGLALGIQGLYNIQFIVKDEQVYVIEVNPRSSRSVPFISKATGIKLAFIATHVMLGHSLKSLGVVGLHPTPPRFYVKVPTFSFSKLSGVDSVLSPEMKSTGEVMGHDETLKRALYKALKASGIKVVNYGTVFVTLSDSTKTEGLGLIKRFYDLGFNIEATEGTGQFLKGNGIKTRIKQKISTGSTEIIDALRKGYVSYVINTSSTNVRDTLEDGKYIRRVAAENNITMFTSLDTARVLLDVLEDTTMKVNSL
jgi:carbamoyl-phosphate synthase large subunit